MCYKLKVVDTVSNVYEVQVIVTMRIMSAVNAKEFPNPSRIKHEQHTEVAIPLVWISCMPPVQPLPFLPASQTQNQAY